MNRQRVEQWIAKFQLDGILWNLGTILYERVKQTGGSNKEDIEKFLAYCLYHKFPKDKKSLDKLADLLENINIEVEVENG